MYYYYYLTSLSLVLPICPTNHIMLRITVWRPTLPVPASDCSSELKLFDWHCIADPLMIGSSHHLPLCPLPTAPTSLQDRRQWLGRVDQSPTNHTHDTSQTCLKGMVSSMARPSSHMGILNDSVAAQTFIDVPTCLSSRESLINQSQPVCFASD